MKIKLLAVGKVRTKAVAELVEGYAAKIGYYYPFELTVVPDVRMARPDADKQKELEGDRILEQVLPTDTLLLLDERGREYTSRELAAQLEQMAVGGTRRLVLVIGGPYGFDRKVYDRANGLLSLSKLTLPHELARLFTVEQLYRAGTITRGEPYHHD